MCVCVAGIGWAVVLIAFYTDFFYNVVIAWCLHFFVASFTDSLPWTSCDNDWNTPYCYDGVVRDASNGTTNVTQLNVSALGAMGYSAITTNITVNASVSEVFRSSPALEYFE